MPKTDAGHVVKTEARERKLIGDVVEHKVMQVKYLSESSMEEYVNCVNTINNGKDDLQHILELRIILDCPDYAKETENIIAENIFKKTIEKNRLLAVLHRLDDSTVCI